MTMTAHTDVLDSTAADVVLSLWEEVDLLPASPWDGGLPEASMWATVPLDGALPLVVGVTCDRLLADRVAGHLFGAAVGDPDRLDALGELANLVAGRVKAELCPGGTTGLPTTGTGPGPDAPGSDYLVDGDWLRLTLQVRSG